MKKFITSAARSTPFLLLLALFCSNPVDKDVKWRSSVDLPITNSKKFYLGAMMDTLFFGKDQVLTTTRHDTIPRAGLPDSVVTHIDTTMKLIKAYSSYDSVLKRQIPDTVTFGFPTHDTASDTISEDSLDDKYYEDVFGPIPLSGAPTNAVTIPLAGAYTASAPVASPAVPLSVRYVYHIELDTAQTLVLSVANNSGADFSSVQVTLGTLGSSTINNLAQNTTDTAQFNVGGKVIDSVMNVTLIATPATSGTFGAGDNIRASFSINGLKATRVVIDDYLLAGYSRTFTNAYNLTDTVDVDYIDIDDGFFVYGVTNHTGLDLVLSVTHRNLWMSSFCIRRNLITDQDLSTKLTHTDSLPVSGNYNGNIASNVSFEHGSTRTYDQHNISKSRLFAEWDPAIKKSVTKVDYFVTLGTPRHDTITLSAGDSLSFVIKTVSFKFKEMYGRSTEQYKRVSDPSYVPVTLPWSKSVTDSLRGDSLHANFKLQKVVAMTTTRIDIPAGAFIDTMRLHYVLSSVTHPQKACSSDVALTHVIRDSVYSRPIDITDVVNDYPDSVKINVSLSIPVNTPIKAVNDLTDPTDPAYTKYIGRMVIHGLVDYNMMAPLCWAVLDTTIMDLGGSRVDISGASGAMDPFAKMTDKHASLNMQVTNFTNVYLRLFALAATDSAKVDPLVDTANAGYIKTNQFTQLINHPTAGYVKLLGNGILIPPRDSNTTIPNEITISDQDLSQLLNAKAIGWRWQVRFVPRSANGVIVSTPDALYNTDWIKLNSWIHIDGVNSVDSLF